MKRKICMKLELPSNFQELMIMHELSFSKGDKSLKNIKTLIESYTYAQEYYDSVNNNILYTYYNDKLIKFLTNPEVTTILDTENSIKRRRNTLKSIVPSTIFEDQELIFNGSYTSNCDKSQIFSKVKLEIEKIEVNTQNAFKSLNTDLYTQKNRFEEQRKLKNEGGNSKKKTYIQKRRNSLIKEFMNKEVNYIHNQEIIKNLIEFSENKEVNNQLQLQREIEDYLIKNTDDMFKGLEQLKVSFEEEIRQIEESGYPELLKGLQIDMDHELETLKEQYEEERRKNIEKIKQKYKNLKKINI